MTKLTREYLETLIFKCQSAIAFASPNANMSFAKTQLAFAQVRLSELTALEAAQPKRA